MRIHYLFFALALAAVFCACKKEVAQNSVLSNDLVSSTVVSTAQKVTTVEPVTISFTSNSMTSIYITVTASPVKGTPSGFTIYWASDVQLAAYTGPVGADGWPLDATVFSQATFSSKAFKLKAGQSVTVDISTLACSNIYKFKAVALASGSLLSSPWSNLLYASTISCNIGSDGI
jgi:hypothetical protein